MAKAKATSKAVGKKSATAKKSAVSTRKPTTSAKKTSSAKAKTASKPKKLKPLQSKTNTKAKQMNEQLQFLIADVQELMDHFSEMENMETLLTGKQRQRLIGAGVRNYGFMDKAWDIARENQQFLPPAFSFDEMSQNMHNLEGFRQLYWVLEKFTAMVNECMLVAADATFKDALRVYDMLKGLDKAGVNGARPLYLALLRFWRRARHSRNDEGEPTLKEINRDIKKLENGELDGEIVLSNKTPHMVGGSHSILDNTYSGHTAIKATEEAEVDEGTSKKK